MTEEEKTNKVKVEYVRGHGFKFTAVAKINKTPHLMDYVEAHNQYLKYFRDHFKEAKEAMERIDELRILEHLPNDVIEPRAKHLLEVVNKLYDLELIRVEARQIVLREMLERTAEILVEYPAEQDLITEFVSALMTLLKHNMDMAKVASGLHQEGFDETKVREMMTELQLIMEREVRDEMKRDYDGS